MARTGRWALWLAAWAGSAALAAGKKVMGIASGQDYQLIGSFCFTFPELAPGETPVNGHIHSQTIVSSAEHKFLVVNYTDVQLGLSCDELVRRAKVIEPLTERSKEVIAYDLTLNVEASMGHQQIAAVVARCGNTVRAEYIVEFTNPGGLLSQQFACEEQGVLSCYMWFALLAGGLSPAFYFAFRVLQHRQAHNDVSAIFFTSAAFFGARVLLFFVHLLVYARNGMGLGMLLFVAQFLDFLSTTMVAVVLVALVHGVYITRPSVPPGSEERQQLLTVVGAFAAACLVSALGCGFQLGGDLTPFGVFRGAASWPYVLARAVLAAFLVNKGMALARGSDASTQEKKDVLLRFTFMSSAWLGVLPFVMLFLSGEDSWRRGEWWIEASNFCLFGALLYHMWPSRFGTLFSCVKPTQTRHPYAEFGISD